MPWSGDTRLHDPDTPDKSCGAAGALPRWSCILLLRGTRCMLLHQPDSDAFDSHRRAAPTREPRRSDKCTGRLQPRSGTRRGQRTMCAYPNR